MGAYPALETARLLLRPVKLADAPAIQALFPQWKIVEFLGAAIPWPYPPDGAETHLRELALPAIERGESWSWSIFPRTEPQRLIGRIDLRDGAEDHRGFWLDPACHGQGLMSEAADAVTDHWFDVLQRPLLRVPKAVANIASRRISQNQGMRCVATIEKDYVGGRMASEIWEITAAEWRARRH